MPLVRNAALWNSTGWAILKWSVILFTVMGFLAAFAGMVGSGGITVNGTLVEGWTGVWLVTLACFVAGLLFGLVWALIFTALAEASKPRG